MIAHFERSDALAHFLHDAAAFVAKNHRELAFRVGAGKRECIRMADTGRHNAHQHFAGLGSGHIDLLDGQRLTCLPGDGGARFHGLHP